MPYFQPEGLKSPHNIMSPEHLEKLLRRYTMINSGVSLHRPKTFNIKTQKYNMMKPHKRDDFQCLSSHT